VPQGIMRTQVKKKCADSQPFNPPEAEKMHDSVPGNTGKRQLSAWILRWNF